MPRKSAVSLSIVPPSKPQRLQAPASLSAKARVVFVETVGSVRPNHFLPSDAPLLAAYAETIIQLRIATGKLQTATSMVDRKGKITSWFNAQERLIKSASILAHRLRLSPQGRSPTVPSRASRMSAYDEIRGTTHG